jgi:putative transposase
MKIDDVWLKPIEVSELLSCPKNRITRNINQYEYRISNSNGGKTYFINLNSLPIEARAKYYEKQGLTKTNIIDINTKKPVVIEEPRLLPVKAQPNDLPETYKETALARYDLVKLWINYREESGLKKTEADKEFIQIYESKKYKYLYEMLGSVSIKTLYRWLTTLEESKWDFVSLSPNYKRDKGINLEPVEINAILKYIKYPTKLKISEIIRWSIADLNEAGYNFNRSEDTYRRFIEDWKSKNYDLWLLHREGEKALNDKCAFYIKRDKNAVNVGDILVLDGHTLNFEITLPFPPYKQKRMTLITVNDFRSDMVLGWEIMLSENKYAIANAVRRALIFLGRICGEEEMALKGRILQMDNGRANKSIYLLGGTDNKRSRWFEQDFNTLGFKGLFEKFFEGVQIAKPYHGQSKATVERFFGVFAELERMTLTYSGISIDNKPPRMSRNEKLHKEVFRNATNGNLIDIESAHLMIAQWLELYSTRKHAGGYWKGLSPAEIMLENIPVLKQQPDYNTRLLPLANLNYMMLEEKVTTLHRRGITFEGYDYMNPALYNIEKGKVNLKIKYDRLNKNSILVFDEAGNFICEASRTDLVHPAAQWLGSEEDQEKFKSQVAIQNNLKQTTTSLYKEHFKDLVDEIPNSVKEMKMRKNKKAKQVEPDLRIEPDFNVEMPKAIGMDYDFKI